MFMKNYRREYFTALRRLGLVSRRRPLIESRKFASLCLYIVWPQNLQFYKESVEDGSHYQEDHRDFTDVRPGTNDLAVYKPHESKACYHKRVCASLKQH